MVNRPPNVNNRPTTVVNRPGYTNIDNRPTFINRPTNINNTNITQTNISQNTQYNISRNFTNNQTNIYAPGQQYGGYGWGGGYAGYGGGYGGYGGGYGAYGGYGSDGAWYGRYQYLHDDWYQGGWNYRPGPTVAGLIADAAFAWLSAGRSLAYSNPYYVAPTTTIITPVLDYSRPIVVAAAPADQVAAALPDQGPVEAPAPLPLTDSAPEAPPQPDDAATGGPGPPRETAEEQAAKETFDEARATFKTGTYVMAQDLVEQALRNLPGDPAMHEFRALTLFAQGKYQEAAGAVYAVLAAGPGWSWDTLKSLYPDVDTYTRQLRDLESYQRRHPDAPEASFLLAYHYLTLGSRDAAVRMLRQTVSVSPKDELSAQLLKMLTQPQGADDRPQPQGP